MPSSIKVVDSGHADASRWLAIRRLGAALLCVGAWAVAQPALATGGAGIAVIYPEIGEPYRAIFSKIVQGIEEEVGARVASHEVRADSDVRVLKLELLRQNTKVVIALGRQGMKMATAVNDGMRVVVGGVLTVPENEARGQSVISLSPDPALLFARMKALMPAAKRVFVVYDPGINAWLMKLAREAARIHGLELAAYEARDLRSAVRSYQEILSTTDGRNDVLWLPQDATTVEEGSVLPLVLRESWHRNIAVFSSNSSHVRRGVLFSLYPDNVALGKRLAGLAQGTWKSGDHATGMMPLRDVQSVLNQRTAKHLGLDYPGVQPGFDTTLPEQ